VSDHAEREVRRGLPSGPGAASFGLCGFIGRLSAAGFPESGEVRSLSLPDGFGHAGPPNDRRACCSEASFRVLTLLGFVVHSFGALMSTPLRVLIIAVLVFATAAACGDALNAAGTRCAGADECAAGLVCLPLVTAPGAGCQTITNICSKPCKDDADCSAVGGDFRCFLACDGKGTCGRVQ
jgi:hypothetical protein